MKYRWYDMTPDEVAKEYQLDKSTGLSSESVKIRLKKYRKNDIFNLESRDTDNFLSYCVTNLSVFLLIIVCTVGAIVERKLSLLAVSIVLMLALILIFPVYIKSKKLLEKKKAASLPAVKVLRDGHLCIIRQDYVVPGDIVILSAGDIVPCDCRLLESDELTVIESFSDSGGKTVRKDAGFIAHGDIPPGKRLNMIFSASIVTKGAGKAIAVATGNMTLLASKGKKITPSDPYKVRAVEMFCGISRILSLLLSSFLFAVTLFSFIFETKLEIFDLFTLTLALCVSSLSDFLPLLSMIIVSCGIFNAEKGKKTNSTAFNIRRVDKIDDICRVNCLVFHRESLYCERDAELSGAYVVGKNDEVPSNSDACLRLLRCAIVAKGIYGLSKASLNRKKALSQTDEILIRKAKRQGIYNKKLDDEYPLKTHISGQVFVGRKYDISIVRKTATTNTAIVCGSTNDILRICSYESDGNDVSLLDKKRKLEIAAICDKKLRDNYTVLAISSKSGVRDDLSVPADTFSDMVFCGLLFIQRPAIRGCAQNIADAKSAGIRLIMLCPDDGESDYDRALNLGIISGKEECVDLKTLSTMSPDMIRINIPTYNLYKGLNQKQINYIINTLQKDLSLRVCYLGRELSQIPSITSADVGMSEYTSGLEKYSSSSHDAPSAEINTTEASKGGPEALGFVSDVTLLKPGTSGEGGFNSMISAISASRGIYGNIIIMCIYLAIAFSSRIAVWGMTALGAVTLSPLYLVFSGCFCDLIAVIVIAFERHGFDFEYRDKGESVSGILPKSFSLKLILFSAFSMLITVGFSIGATMLCTAFSAEALHCETIIMLGIFIAKAVLIPELSSGGFFRRSGRDGSRKIKLHNIYPLYILTVSFFAVISFFVPAAASITGIVKLSGSEWALIFIPSIFECMAFEIVRAVKHSSERKK